jgi:hypothetical protein
MVNNCPSCTVMAGGIIVVLICLFCYYGLGALLFAVTALILAFGISYHKRINACVEAEKIKKLWDRPQATKYC